MHEIPDDTTDTTSSQVEQAEAPSSEITEVQRHAVSSTLGITRSTMISILEERVPGFQLREGVTDEELHAYYLGAISGDY